MRLLVGFEKGEQARYLSHLDIQRGLQRAIRRAGLPVLYSSGFNPHPLISFASALPVGVTGSLEVLELQTQEIGENEAFMALNAHAAPGLNCVQTRIVGPEFPSLTPLTQAAKYEISLLSNIPTKALAQSAVELLSYPIPVQKKGKAGIKTIDLLPLIYEFSVNENGPVLSIEVIGAHTQEGSLPIALLAKTLLDAADPNGFARLHRLGLFTRKQGGPWTNIMTF